MKALCWRIRIVWLALRWIPRLNLGDQVRYQGQRWWLNQGVNAPFWNLVRVVDGEYREYIHARGFSKVRTPHNYWRSFRSGYRFYMTSWYAIWMNEGVQPWMRGLKIWGGGSPLR